MYKPLPACSCSASAEYEKERDEEKVHQFVMGLDESRFGGVCQGIISSDSLVDLGEAYSKVIREEQRLASFKEREAQQSAVGFVAKKDQVDSSMRRSSQCSHCGRKGHDKSNCWQLVGFPDWWEERSTKQESRGSQSNRGRGSSGSDRGKSNGPKAHNAHATSSNESSFPAFTEEQLKALTQLINERTKSSSDKLSGKLYGDLILDTGASHHMTGDLSFLNISSIPPCPVCFADGNKTFATHIGVLYLSENIILSNVLFVLNLF